MRPASAWISPREAERSCRRGLSRSEIDEHELCQTPSAGSPSMTGTDTLGATIVGMTWSAPGPAIRGRGDSVVAVQQTLERVDEIGLGARCRSP